MKVDLVVKASKGVIVEGYAFADTQLATEKADDMRNSKEFNENDDDVDHIYDVPVEGICEKPLDTSAVSSQHQTNIIAAVRSILGLKKGDRILWVLRNGEIIIRKAQNKT